MRLRNSDLNLIGSVLLFAALVMIYVYGNDTLLPLGLIIASLALTLVLIARRRRTPEEPDSDERTRKNGAFGLSWSWLIGVCGMVVLFWADYFGIWRPGALVELGASILLFLLSAIVFLAYLSHKGDADNSCIPSKRNR